MNAVLPKIRFRDPQIEMAHGAGGKASRRLVEGLFAPLLMGASTEPLGDAAHIDVDGTRIAITADSFVVKPLRFPGGSIGELAVNGTVNDLAVSGVKHFEPTIVASATKIAAVRTGIGFVLGPPATFLGAYFTEALFFRSGYSPFQNVAVYGVLFIARIFIWALVLYLFTKKAPLPISSFWLYALLGAIVSSLLDFTFSPGTACAFFTISAHADFTLSGITLNPAVYVTITSL